MIWVARQRVRVVVNVRLILRLWRNVGEIARNGLRRRVVLRRRRISAMDIHRAELLYAQAELLVELIMLIRVGWRKVKTFHRASMERGLTVLKIVVAALPIDAVHWIAAGCAGWDFELNVRILN